MCRLAALLLLGSALALPRGYDGREPLGELDRRSSFSSKYVAMHGAGEEYRPEAEADE